MKKRLLLPIVAGLLMACNLIQVISPEAEAPESETASTPAPTLAATEAVLATETLMPTTTAGEPTAAPVTPPALSGDILPPLPAGPVTISLIDMVDSNAGWAVGGAADPGNRILRTSDGGLTWQDVSPPMPGGADLLPMAAFLDVDTTFVVYNPADPFSMPASVPVWFTNDGGANWTLTSQITELTGEGVWFPLFLEFIDAQYGYLLVNVGAGMSHSYVALYGTNDGGQTWDLRIDPFTDSSIQLCQKTDMRFLNEMLGLLTFDCGGVVPATTIATTIDGGYSWEVHELLEAELTGAGFAMESSYCFTDSLNFDRMEFPLDVFLRASCRKYEGDTLTEGQFIIHLEGSADAASLHSYPGGRLYEVENTLYAIDHTIYRGDEASYSFSLLNTVSWEGQFDFLNLTRVFAVARNEGESALVYSTNGGSSWAILEPVVAP